MKNLLKLGKVLNKAEQKQITGGSQEDYFMCVETTINRITTIDCYVPRPHETIDRPSQCIETIPFDPAIHNEATYGCPGPKIIKP